MSDFAFDKPAKKPGLFKKFLPPEGLSGAAAWLTVAISAVVAIGALLFSRTAKDPRYATDPAQKGNSGANNSATDVAEKGNIVDFTSRSTHPKHENARDSANSVRIQEHTASKGHHHHELNKPAKETRTSSSATFMTAFATVATIGLVILAAGKIKDNKLKALAEPKHTGRM